MVYLFIASALLVVTPYFIYPLLLHVWARLAPKPIKTAEILPKVTLLIAAYNEETVIEEKIKNCLVLDYPREQLEIVVVADGSTDGTAQIVKRFEGDGVKLYHNPERHGKLAAISRVWDMITGEIVLLSDANNFYNKSAVRKIVRNFNDPGVGGVSGEKHILSECKDTTPVSQGEGVYWKFERFVKKRESKIDSICGAMGEIFAIRKRLFVSPQENNIADDCLFVSLQVVLQGYRLIWEPEAKSFEKASLTMRDEFDRKTRIVAAALQTMPKVINILNPLKSRIWLQMISHKFLKWFAPVFMISAFLSNAFLLHPVFRVLFLAQIVFYGMACAYPLFAITDRRIKVFYYPFFFCLGNFAALAGIFKWILNKQPVAWKRLQRA